MENYKDLGFVEMTDTEMYDTDGGFPWVVVAGCVVIAGIGIYNGYKDTKDQK